VEALPDGALEGALQSPKTPERLLEVLRQPFFPLDPFPGERVSERDPRGVQEWPIQLDLA
jgi:hypothetical protein